MGNKQSALDKIRELYKGLPVPDETPVYKELFKKPYKEFMEIIESTAAESPQSYYDKLVLFYRENKPGTDITEELIPRSEGEGEIFSTLYKKQIDKNVYKWYINSDKWRTFRNEIFKERGFHCELCSSKKNLHLHHITYENFMNEEKEDVMILCRSCHEKAHKS